MKRKSTGVSKPKKENENVRKKRNADSKKKGGLKRNAA